MIRLRTTGLRIALSLGLGLALWLFVSYTENPDRTTALGTIPVTADNLSPGLTLINSTNGEQVTDLPSVNLTVESDQETTSRLLSSDFRAYVDLSGLGAGEHKVPVNVVPNRPNLNQVTTFTTPDDLSIRIDQLITKTVPLTVEVTGQVPFSFERLDPHITSDGKPISEVQVSGPQNRVDRVVRARTTANVDRLTANYESSRPIEPLNGNGEIVAGVTVTPATARVLVPIRPSLGLKRVPIVPQTTGAPASGFVVTDVTVDPQFVNVTGGSGALDDVNQIATANVDINNAGGTLSQTVDLQVPPQIAIQPGQPTTATVTVTIQPIVRSFSVKIPAPVSALNAPKGDHVEITPTVVNITVSGAASQLSDLDATLIKATVDLAGFKPGTYTLTPDVTVPRGISLDSPPAKVTVVITEPSTPTPAPSPTPTTAPTQEAAPTDAPPSATDAPPPADSRTPASTDNTPTPPSHSSTSATPSGEAPAAVPPEPSPTAEP
jgi:YbbR domain-containing protein